MVRLLSPFEGYTGSTAYTYLDGGLNTKPEYEIYDPGYAFVDAPTAGEAIREAVTGTVRMTRPPISPTQPAEVFSFPFTVGTAGFTAAEHKPYLLLPGAALPLGAPPPTPGSSLWGIYLEDQSHDPPICDWDYNDHSFVAEVLNLDDPPPPPPGPGSISGVVWDDNPNQNHLRDFIEAGRDGVGVSLYTADGTFIKSTVTNTNGAYSFTGLPVGGYRIRVNVMFLEGFVQPNYPGDETRDSDVDLEGWSDPIPLGGGYPISGTADAGLLALPDPVQPSNYGVWLVKPGQMQNAYRLKVAKWETAFAVGYDAQGKPYITFRPPDVNGFDFIDHDVDRFNVVVKDTVAWGNNTPSITAKVRTANLPAKAALYDDNDTDVALVRMLGRAGYYISDSQLLVSNDVDDAFAIPAFANPNRPGTTTHGIGTDDTSPAANSFNEKKGYPNNNYRFPVSDRTHLIALGGKAIATYTPAGQAAVSNWSPVKIQHTVKLHVNIMRETVNGTQTVATQKVLDHIRAMEEIYAQIGMAIQVVGIIGPTDPPNGAGLNTPGEKPSLDDAIPTVENGLVWLIPQAEDRALLSDQTIRTPTQGGKDDIEVYYVNRMTSGTDGLSYARSHLRQADAGLRDSVIIREDHTYIVLAHEAGHILENQGNAKVPIGDLTHYPYPGIPRLEQRVNLMVHGKFAITSNTVFDSRRLTLGQEKQMTTTLTELVEVNT